MEATSKKQVSARIIGRVTSFHTGKGYGFVADAGGQEMFVAQRVIQGDGPHILAIGDRVRYAVTEGPEGPSISWVRKF